MFSVVEVDCDYYLIHSYKTIQAKLVCKCCESTEIIQEALDIIWAKGLHISLTMYSSILSSFSSLPIPHLPSALFQLQRHVYHMLHMFLGLQPKLSQGIKFKVVGAKKNSSVLL